MKRIFVLTVLLVLGIMTFIMAAPVTIADPSGQSQIQVRDGAFKPSVSNGIVFSASGSGVIYTGYCRLQSVSIYAPTAGDAVSIYDNGIASEYFGGIRTFEFELATSANTSSVSLDCKGVPFENGIYYHATDTDVLVTVIFDY